MHEAYDALDETMRRRIDGRPRHVTRAAIAPESRRPQENGARRSAPSVLHPLVRTHPEAAAAITNPIRIEEIVSMRQERAGAAR
jgi:alpha-ketoglutarate-dependent taurine dioxygenase